MAVTFQKAALALLLCAPSTLHKNWMNGASRADLETQLRDLGFSDDAIPLALETMTNLGANRDSFVFIASKLTDDPWDGVEPHPKDPDAQDIVAAMRDLDEK